MERQQPELGRPTEGVGHYVRDIIYGALDGVITTLAVISGASGAHLERRVGIILGLANLAGDGLSMGASNYLGLRSELLQTGRSIGVEMPWRHGMATVAAFIAFGAIPLLAYAVPALAVVSTLQLAVVLSVIALSVMGILRAPYVGISAARSAAEVTLIGALASGSAYAIGALASRLIA